MRQGKKKRCQSSHIVAYAESQNMQKGGEELNILKANYVVKKRNKKGFYGKEDEPTVAGGYKTPMIPFWHDPCVKIALQLHLLLALH